MAGDQAEYRSPAGRAKAAIALLGSAAAVQLVAFGSTLLEIGLIYDLEAGLPVSDAEIDANDTRQAVIGGIEVAMVVFSAIPFLMWVHRTHANLRALGTGPFKFTPGWAVGWWFIPFANLVQPVRAMLEAWRGSYPGGARPAPAATLVGLWWARSWPYSWSGPSPDGRRWRRARAGWPRSTDRARPGRPPGAGNAPVRGPSLTRHPHSK